MSKILMTTNLKRESGKLYFCGTDSNGNLTVCEAIMRRGGRKKVKK